MIVNEFLWFVDLSIRISSDRTPACKTAEFLFEVSHGHNNIILFMCNNIYIIISTIVGVDSSDMTFLCGVFFKISIIKCFIFRHSFCSSIVSIILLFARSSHSVTECLMVTNSSYVSAKLLGLIVVNIKYFTVSRYFLVVCFLNDNIYDFVTAVEIWVNIVKPKQFVSKQKAYVHFYFYGCVKCGKATETNTRIIFFLQLELQVLSNFLDISKIFDNCHTNNIISHNLIILYLYFKRSYQSSIKIYNKV